MRITHRLFWFSFAVCGDMNSDKTDRAVGTPEYLLSLCPEFRYAVFGVDTLNAVGIFGFMTDRLGIVP